MEKYEIKKLIKYIYPASNTNESYKQCAKELGFSFSCIHKTCEQKKYPVRDVIPKFLLLKKEMKDLEIREKIIEYDKKCFQDEKREIKEKINFAYKEISEILQKIDKRFNYLAADLIK